MKHFIFTLTLLTVFFSTLFSQNNGLSFQGIARNGDGDALSGQTIKIRFSIGEKDEANPFSEVQSGINTDAFGVFSAIIGSINFTNFDAIDFSKNLMLKVEVALGSGSDFVEISNSQITKVPVAMYAQQSFFPAGMIIPFAGPRANIPVGWLPCEGQILDKKEYSSLFNAIEYAWGNEGGNFRLPDLRGMFLRGVDGTKGLDEDKELRTASNKGGSEGNKVGSIQTDENRRHSHVATTSVAGEHKHIGNRSKSGVDVSGVGVGLVFDNNTYMADTHVWPGNNKINTDDYIPYNAAGNHSHNVGIAETGGKESRPVNAYINYIIKL